LSTNVNSRIDGVIKDLAELKSSLQFTQKDVEDLNHKAKVALQFMLNLPFKVEIERAHRTGKVNRRSDDNASSTRPRTVICRLVSWKQKDPILKAARIVKPEGRECLSMKILRLKLFKGVKIN
ncbi:unnamed protein product, partial [Porites evermanni]